jgi:hypothetical protein
MSRRLASVAIVAAIAGVTLWVHLFELNGITRWDSAAFLAIGKLLQHGLLLYRDLWDTKPPGIYLYQSAVFAVLPVEVWSLRLTDYVLYVGAGIVFYRLCAVEARWPLALAATAVWLFLNHHPSFNIAGFYTEEYTAMCAIAAVAAALRYWRAGGLGWVAASGVATAAAIIFKHPGVACAVPVLCLISGRRPLRALPLYAVCSAVPLLLVVAYFWWHAALAEFFDCQFLYLLVQQGVTQTGDVGLAARFQELGARTWERFAPYPVLLWPAVLGSAVCLLRPSRFRLAALTWLAADLLLIAAQKFYYEHYFIQVFASALLVGVIGAAWLLQARPRERPVVRVARLALSMAVFALAWRPLLAVIAHRQPVVAHAWATLRAGPSQWPEHPGGPYEAEIGRYVNERTAPDDRFFIYETGTALAAFWTADRLPASRYLFSIVPQANFARQAEQRAELERTRPAYVVITGNSVFRYFTPLLLAHYTLAAVRTGEYRVEIWARNELAPFGDGTRTGLVEEPQRGGLVLDAASGAGDAAPAEMSAAHRGSWTSPIVEVIGGGADLPLDWNPRADLAANPTGQGFPSATASGAASPDDPRAVLGTPTASGRWSVAEHTPAQSLTVQLGFEAVTDRIILRGTVDGSDTSAGRPQLLAAAGADFAPLAGAWEAGGDGAWTVRFPPRPLSALRLVAPPSGRVALQRVEVPAVGMGLAVRYRTGPIPDLTGAPWVAVNDEGEPRVVAAQRYVQIQCEVWSRYDGYGPVLRWLQIGRLRFQLDAATTAAGARLRTARQPSAVAAAA